MTRKDAFVSFCKVWEGWEEEATPEARLEDVFKTETNLVAQLQKQQQQQR